MYPFLLGACDNHLLTFFPYVPRAAFQNVVNENEVYPPPSSELVQTVRPRIRWMYPSNLFPRLPFQRAEDPACLTLFQYVPLQALFFQRGLRYLLPPLDMEFEIKRPPPPHLEIASS